MAATEVFSIPELLEAILLNTSRRDIIRASRVSKHFAAVIEGSQKLGEKLWLRASTPTILIGSRRPRQHGIRAHPSRQIKFAARHNRPGDQLIVQPHLLIANPSKTFFDDNGFNIFVDLSKFFAWRQSGNKWQNMFVSQPPPTAVTVKFEVDDPRRQKRGANWVALRDDIRRIRVERAGGVRFAHITESPARYAAGLEGGFEVLPPHGTRLPLCVLDGQEVGLALQDAACETDFAVQTAQTLSEEDFADWE